MGEIRRKSTLQQDIEWEQEAEVGNFHHADDTAEHESLKEKDENRIKQEEEEIMLKQALMMARDVRSTQVITLLTHVGKVANMYEYFWRTFWLPLAEPKSALRRLLNQYR